MITAIVFVSAAVDRIPEVAEQIAALDGVSEAGRQKTIAVFGEPLSPAAVVERICSDVRAKGLEAVLRYTEKLDGVQLSAANLQVDAANVSLWRYPRRRLSAEEVRDTVLAASGDLDTSPAGDVVAPEGPHARAEVAR